MDLSARRRAESAFKEAHYARWLDELVPALAGFTPRQAAQSSKHRARLDLLLKSMENHEARLPAALRYDFTKLREALGLGR